ncbi:MAG TPA: hypothetical protein VHF22_08770 [Planctomycetota bacterium]|nr:hypothetical protein [Planctomycetota bacterium]
MKFGKLGVIVAAIALVATSACAAAEVKQSARGMTYSIRVPRAWDAAAGGLLVVALHGQGGSNAQFMPAVEGAPFLADALLVAPNATKNAAWEESDIDLVADLIREVTDRYHSTRTIAFGFSRGAFMAFGLGMLRPDVVQACIPHSGGLPPGMPVPPTDGVKAQVFYVIHGDADGTVNVQQSRDAVQALEAAGVKRVKYDELKGLGHSLDPAAVKRGFDWVQQQLGPLPAGMTDAEAKAKLAALEKAVGAKDAAAAGEALEGLARAPRAWQPRVAKAAEKGLKGKDDALAVACAEGLGKVGGDPATGALIGALASAESGKRAEVAKAIEAALEKVTGKSFASAKEWKRWAAGKS